MAEGLQNGDVVALRALALRFGEAERSRKAAALAACASREIADPRVLVAYHDCLLCLCAYPETRALLGAAQAELRRVADAARRICDTGPARHRARLANSGVAWSTVTIGFGWDIARWLVRRFPDCAEIDSFADDGASLPSILGGALAPLEFELAASEESPEGFLDRAGAGRRGTRLAWLVAALDRLPCSDALREHLFEELKAFIVIRPGGTALSRTFVRGLAAPAYFHRDGLARDVDVAALLATPLPPARRLAARERQHVVDAGRAMLAALGRETDAIAQSHPEGVAWHDVGRGIAVALYAMRPDRRSPLDSHIGMMVFRNGIPVGYGGGWPFAGTCRIGVNVFPPFRGGESALLFCQVLRVYRQRFGVARFVAEPSQYGGTNREGLESGAFWFYYRLGFRPVERRSAQLAAGEWARMEASPGYRTPVAALRRFANSDIELRLEEAPAIEPAELSEAVTRWIGERHHGDRGAAERAASRIVARALGATRRTGWSGDERRAFAALAPLVAQIPDLARWPAGDRRALAALIRAKGRDEYRFHDLLARHGRFRDALAKL